MMIIYFNGIEEIANGLFTPYIVNSQGEYVYGKSRAISFNQLKSYDTAVTSEQ